MKSLNISTPPGMYILQAGKVYSIFCMPITTGYSKSIYSFDFISHLNTSLVGQAYQKCPDLYFRYGDTSSLWRIFEFKLSEMSPSVEKLAIHLPNEHYVVYDPDKTKTSSELKHMMESRERTTLTAFFELNRTDPNARQYLYTEILRHYRWVKSSKKKEEVKTFQKRKRRSGQGESLGEGESTQIGRIPVIVPGRPDRDELFYLRLLLHNVPGPTSWDFLKTVEEQMTLPLTSIQNWLGLYKHHL